MLIYTENISPRFQYIAEFAGKLIAGKSFELTTDKNQYLESASGKINYSPHRISDDECWIKPHGLLSETTVTPQQIQCSERDGRKFFFSTEGDWPFDIFAASFYLLTRYEEYLPHSKDMYGRYSHENSLAFREKFLGIPLVNFWWNDFKNAYRDRFSTFNSPSPQAFTFLPTYDIDIAWSYKSKGWQRNLGGFLKSAFRGDWKQNTDRISVLRKKSRDPYDCYGWLNKLHENYRLKPYYFFLVADKKGKYDRNISPSRPELQELIRDHFIRYPIGLHPSWRSGDEHELLKREIETLSRITGSGCLSSRQHYIRFDLPETYRRLLDAGIRYDFSMGYGSINGFRASVTTPFYWYDLQEEKQTELMLFPFCYMEANSYYEQKFTAQQALEEMRDYRKVVKSVGGMLITIWHNHFLGNEKVFGEWKQVYEEFIRETAEKV